MAQDNPWDAAPIVRDRNEPRAARRSENPWDAAPVVESSGASEGPAAPSTMARLADPLATIQGVVPGVRITSGYRDPDRNRRAGGAPNSYHTRGTAFDLTPPAGMSMADLERQLRASGLPFRELLNEGDHVHVAWDGDAVGPVESLSMAEQPEIAVVEQTSMAETTAPDLEAAPAPGTRENPIDLTRRPLASEIPLLVKGAFVRGQNGEVYALPGDAFIEQPRAGDEMQSNGVYIRRPNVQDSAAAFSAAALEQIPFGDEAVALASGAVTGRGYDATRDQMALNQRLQNQTNRGERIAGGVSGFVGGLALPGAGYIGRGATALNRASRSAQVGAGYGALYGAGAADDSYASRLQGLGQGAVIGAATGGLGQMGIERLRGIAPTIADSQARRLSRAGVDLTPGQMVAEIPVVGPALRALEEGASSIPVAGSAISGARQRGIEGFNRVVINRALSPIGVTIPENIPAGYPAVEYAQTTLNRAYDDVLTDVELRPDEELYDGLGRAINQAVESSGAPGARRITREITDRVFRYLGENSDAPITGQQFKALESEFTTLAGNALNATDGATQAVGRAYQAVNEALREGLERQNPGRREALRRVNDAYSRMVRVETAAGSSASQATEGVFSPTQLGVAVSSQSGRRASSRGDARMQELVGPARGILNSRIGDSGTATRGAVTALASGAAGTATVLNPQVAVPVIVGVSALYSRPAQRILNGIYRATDNPGSARRRLAQLAELVRREPALQPYYQEAVRFVTGQEPLRPQEPASPSQTREERPAA